MGRSLAILAVSVLLAAATPAAAVPVTLSQAQLLLAAEVTTSFGGNGQVLSRAADGDGVLFEIEGGTVDYGKVAVRFALDGADLTPFESFGLHIEVVSAPDPVEVNPFVQTGPTGTVFTEDEPGVKVQGDAFDSFVPLAGVGELDTGFGLGFQYFTAGDVLEPESQLVLLRVSPIPGAAFIEPVPEPGTALLTLAALCAGVSWTRRGSREP